MTLDTAARTGQASSAKRSLAWFLGPAFVAAIAYVDPGNVAANLTAGARYGYLLVWVLVVANAMAVLVQYLSAKLGLVIGRSPARAARRPDAPAGPGWLFWVQAELVAAATDLAEVIGGAIALHILFGLPLLLGGLIVGVVSMVVLAVQSRRGSVRSSSCVVGLAGGDHGRLRRRSVLQPGVRRGRRSKGLVPAVRGQRDGAAGRQHARARP